MPSAVEVKVLRERYEQQHDRFKADTDAASKLVNVGQYPREAQLDVAELAAWTAYCNMVLNLDEVLTRE
jgi:predicted RNA-binding Zn ribbon-like protein